VVVGGQSARHCLGYLAARPRRAALERASPVQPLIRNHRYAGFLLPPFPTEEAVETAVARIAHYRNELDTPFLIETPATYLRELPGELRDGEYVREGRQARRLRSVTEPGQRRTAACHYARWIVGSSFFVRDVSRGTGQDGANRLRCDESFVLSYS
jgi:hypothetical protein